MLGQTIIPIRSNRVYAIVPTTNTPHQPPLELPYQPLIRFIYSVPYLREVVAPAVICLSCLPSLVTCLPYLPPSESTPQIRKPTSRCSPTIITGGEQKLSTYIVIPSILYILAQIVYILVILIRARRALLFQIK